MEWEFIDIEPSKELNHFMNITMFTKYQCLASQPSENMVLMEYDEFIGDLYKSFLYNSQKILTLFKNDVPREKLSINGIEYNNAKKAFREINKIVKDVKLRKTIYMLCTQAVMYIPCYLLTRTYCNDDYYLGEAREKESMIIDVRLNKDSPTTEGVVACINISKVLRIFYLEKGDDVTYCKIKFHIHVECGQFVVLRWIQEY